MIPSFHKDEKQLSQRSKHANSCHTQTLVLSLFPVFLVFKHEKHLLSYCKPPTDLVFRISQKCCLLRLFLNFVLTLVHSHLVHIHEYTDNFFTFVYCLRVTSFLQSCHMYALEIKIPFPYSHVFKYVSFLIQYLFLFTAKSIMDCIFSNLKNT